MLKISLYRVKIRQLPLSFYLCQQIDRSTDDYLPLKFPFLINFSCELGLKASTRKRQGAGKT